MGIWCSVHAVPFPLPPVSALATPANRTCPLSPPGINYLAHDEAIIAQQDRIQQEVRNPGRRNVVSRVENVQRGSEALAASVARTQLGSARATACARFAAPIISFLMIYCRVTMFTL